VKKRAHGGNKNKNKTNQNKQNKKTNKKKTKTQKRKKKKKHRNTLWCMAIQFPAPNELCLVISRRSRHSVSPRSANFSNKLSQ
jgi:hypothetical protein